MTSTAKANDRQLFKEHFEQYVQLYGIKAFLDGSTNSITMAGEYYDVEETGSLTIEEAAEVIDQVIQAHKQSTMKDLLEVILSNQSDDPKCFARFLPESGKIMKSRAERMESLYRAYQDTVKELEELKETIDAETAALIDYANVYWTEDEIEKAIDESLKSQQHNTTPC